MQIETIVLTSKNVIFRGRLFADFETIIGFLAFQILIPSLSWPCTQNEANFNYQFTVCLEKCDFLQMTSNISKLYTRGRRSIIVSPWFHHAHTHTAIVSTWPSLSWAQGALPWLGRRQNRGEKSRGERERGQPCHMSCP